MVNLKNMDMSNNDIEYKLWQYLDEELSPAEIAAIDQQLSSDDQLNADFLEIKQLHKELQQLPLSAVSPDFAGQVMTQLDSVKASSFHIRWIITMSSIYVLVGLGFLFFDDFSALNIQWGLNTFDMGLSSINYSYLMVFTLVPVLLFFDRWLSKNIRGGLGLFMLSV